ncbi:MAG TPA: hypothetical protein VFM05_00725, partial [Candidatus Saccharimonadales bacterium]|nr:hypothetical protein [Candidatus Saccharimonadales bacterium]
NIDTSENAVSTTVKVVDQCNNPLRGVVVYPEVVSFFHLDQQTTARAQYGPQPGATDTQGAFTFPMQLDNQGGLLRAEYRTLEGLIIRNDLSLPNVNDQVRVFQVPSCTISDTQRPVLSVSSWTANPKSTSQVSLLTVSAADNVGVVGGEYFIGDVDPGLGAATPMSWDGTNLTTTFGTDMPTGVYKITMRAVDVAGNMSEPLTGYLVVYNPNGAYMTGRRTIVPALENGDVLPGLISNEQNDPATFGFNVRYDNQGQISGGSDLQFRYHTDKWCLQPNRAQGCHSMELSATSIAWLSTQGVNGSTGIFQGTAMLRVNGTSSTVTFRVMGLDGARLDPTIPDHFTLYIYTQGSDPNRDQPVYRVSSNVVQGSIRIIP